MGFCVGCPVPEILATVESGEAEFCKVGLLANPSIARCTVELMKLIADEVECTSGPDISPADPENSWINCSHPYMIEMSTLGDALEIDDAGIVLTAKFIKREY